MPVAPFAYVLAALAGPSAAAGPEAAEPLISHADGSWTVTRTMGESPVSLERATDGLLVDEEAHDGFDRMREAEADAQAEKAFEEAIEQTRQERHPQ